MRPAEYEAMLRAEDRHWWYRGLRSLLVAQLERQGLPPRPVIADVGCGTGGAAAAVREAFPSANLVGLDVSSDALRLARGRGAARLVRASANSICLAPASVDAVVCLDVLSHEGVDAAAALRGCSQALKPGGALLLNVPAFRALRGRHDEAVSNVARFTRGEVADLVEGARLAVRFSTYWNAALLPGLLAWRLASRRLPGPARSDLALPPAPVNAALAALLRAEVGLAQVCPLPFGASLFVTARKPV